MVSSHTETARFKWPGHKNELCFFRNTLLLTLACVGLARLPKSWVLRRRGGRLRQSWPRISSWETRCLSELVLRVMPRTFHLLLGPARIPSGNRLYFCGQGPVCPQKYKIIVHCNFYFVPSFNASRGTNLAMP